MGSSGARARLPKTESMEVVVTEVEPAKKGFSSSFR